MGGSDSPASSPIHANKLSFASVVKGTKPAASPESPIPNKADTNQVIESPPVKKSTLKHEHSSNNSVDSSTIPDIDTLDEELENFRKKLGQPIPSSSESESSDSSGVIEVYTDYKKQRANAKTSTAGTDSFWSSNDSTVPEVIDPATNSPVSTTSTPDVLLTPKAIPSPAKNDCKLPDHSKADWESYLDELDDEPKHSKPTKLEPKLSQRAPAPPGHKICAADYKFDTSQALTAAFNASMAQLQELMLESYCNDENGAHPKSGPFEVDIDDKDGAFIICNSSSNKLLRWTRRATPKNESCSSLRVLPRLPVVNPRLQARPSQANHPTLLATPLPPPGSAAETVEPKPLNGGRLNSTNPVTEGFPKSTFSSQVVKSFQGQVYKHVVTNFHNKRSLKCISNVSSSEARSKLLGFLVCMHAGHVDFPPMCQVSKSHIVPRTFKYYVPLEDGEFPEESMDVEMEDCDESEKSPTWDEAKALLSSRKEWFRRVITGSLNPVKSFGNREVHLEGRTFRYDRDYWDKKSSSPWFDWPRPSTANQIMYLIFVHGWGGLTNTLQSVST
eukprot:scaffold12007_cov42-Cyclotella_meneghiniana.AAC.15